MKITFKGQSDNLELQVKQIMRENYDSMQDEIVQNCSKRINKDFRQKFDWEISNAKNTVSNADTKNILNTLKDAYQNAGLTKDAEVINKQIKRLDVQA